MEVRKSTRVILESDALKSPGFTTNNTITSLILNEDHNNQIESELSFLVDESDLQSLSPQPQPDLLIDLGDMSSAAVLNLTHDVSDTDDTTRNINIGNEVEDSQIAPAPATPAVTVTTTMDMDTVEVDVIQKSESKIESEGVSVGVNDQTTESTEEPVAVVVQADIDNLAVDFNDDNDPKTPEMNDDGLSDVDTDDTNHVKEQQQKIKEMTILEQSSSSKSSSTSSIVSSSSVVTSSTMTTKSSVKESTAMAKEITAAATATATNVTGTAKQTATTVQQSTKTKEALVSVSTNNNQINNKSPPPTIDSNNTNPPNVNGNVLNESEMVTTTKTVSNSNSGSGSNKKKSKNANKTSSESISVRRSFDGDLNSLADNHTTTTTTTTSEDNQEFLDHEVTANTNNEQNEDVSLSQGVDKDSNTKNTITIPNRSSTIIHRPKSCLGIHNEVVNKRWSGTGGDTSKSQSQNGPHIVFIPGDDFSGVSVNKLKSSFTKFDNLAKKEMQSGAVLNKTSDSHDQQSTEVCAQPPNHICKGCNAEVFQMELLRAEKVDWHKNCFRCTVCNKTLTLDIYSSNEGKIYCKPHFRELFKPKAVAQTEEEDLKEQLKKKVEVIIRESEPVPLPPDVVRASEKSGPDIQDLKLDVKSKYELFESLTNNTEVKENRPAEEISEELKNTGSVQSRLAKYKSRVAAATSTMEVTGVADEDLAGGGPRHRVNEDGSVEGDEGESSGDEVVDARLLRKLQPVDEINRDAIDEVRNKWEVGINSKKEEISEARREEQSRFRSRLLMGKNTQMKDMYEKACEEMSVEEKQSQQLEDFEAMKSSENKAKDLKQLFEKGELITAQRESNLEKEVFESEIAKNSRSLFKEMDKNVAAGTPTSISPVNRQSQLRRQESGSIRKQEFAVGEVVRSGDVNEEIITPEDISTKFKFFETFQEKLSENKSKERFRMTPPRELGDKESSPPVEIYRDPNIIRSSDPSTDSDIPVTRTASKMLSVFRQLEQEQNEAGDAKKNFKPLKEFTPPRETLKSATNGHEESGDSQDEDDSGEEEDIDDGGDSIGHTPADLEKDELLKQVGSLARATSLRLKFERWEREENAKNKDQYDGNVSMMDEEQDGSNLASIESTKELRAKFENYKDSAVEQEKLQKMRRGETLKVKRFVELTNNSGTNMENCAACEKRVYVMEKVEAGGKTYHKTCFRCSQCKSLLRMDTFTSNKGVLFCTPHFKQLFKIKGNYDEGFGHETHRQAFERKKRAADAAAAAEEKEN